MTRSPNRTHDRTSFFKYMSAATAQIILSNGTLRWSSPVLFNDPFDVPRELSFGLNPGDIVEALGRRMAALIEQPPEDTSHLEPKLRLIIETVKKGISSELKSKLLAGLQESAASHRPDSASMNTLRDLWRTWLHEHRILCLTESPAHAAMWFHYADKYTGAVLEFRCDDQLDSAWLAAKPITYPKVKPAIYTADGWAELLTMQLELAIQKLLHVSIYTKAPDWSYESEWRIGTFKRPTDTGPFTDYKFHPKEIASVYLGALINDDDKATLLTSAAKYPDVRVFETSIGMTREFVFNEIHG